MASSRSRTALALSLMLAFLASVRVDARAWGKAEHRVVATLATNLITPEAHTQIVDPLGPGVILAHIATWADEVRPSRPSTRPWHYVNIPLSATEYDARRDCGRGCVVSAIERSLQVLQNPAEDRAVREDALRWVVHFVADLHQPLHVVGDGRGGNDVLVQFMGRQTTLHRVWDGAVIDHAYPNAVALYKPVHAVLQTGTWHTWADGRAEEWAMETHRVAQETVYLFPDSRVIDDRYVEKALPVIHEQLARAAVRLAGVLNQALRQH
jgi:hypothetical protein